MRSGIIRYLRAVGMSIGSILMLQACHVLTGPDRHQLVIESGFYEMLKIDDRGRIRYKMEITYYVTGAPCEVGGYGLSLGSQGGVAVTRYLKQMIEPGKKYVLSDNFSASSELEVAPIFRMQGFLVGSADTHDGLSAEITLHLR